MQSGGCRTLQTWPSILNPSNLCRRAIFPLPFCLIPGEVSFLATSSTIDRPGRTRGIIRHGGYQSQKPHRAGTPKDTTLLALPLNLMLTIFIRWSISLFFVQPLTNVWLRRTLTRTRLSVDGTFGVARSKLLAYIVNQHAFVLEMFVLALLGFALGFLGFQLIGLALRRKHWFPMGSLNLASMIGFSLRSSFGLV